MTSAKLSVNRTEYTLPEVDGVTLQFALRDDLGLTGTKFGCGMSQCGACMVLVDGAPAEKPSQKVDETSEIAVTGEALPYVGKGGPKMEAALKRFRL